MKHLFNLANKLFFRFSKTFFVVGFYATTKPKTIQTLFETYVIKIEARSLKIHNKRSTRASGILLPGRKAKAI
jgi:hypothetical protein